MPITSVWNALRVHALVAQMERGDTTREGLLPGNVYFSYTSSGKALIHKHFDALRSAVAEQDLQLEAAGWDDGGVVVVLMRQASEGEAKPLLPPELPALAREQEVFIKRQEKPFDFKKLFTTYLEAARAVVKACTNLSRFEKVPEGGGATGLGLLDGMLGGHMSATESLEMMKAMQAHEAALAALAPAPPLPSQGAQTALTGLADIAATVVESEDSDAIVFDAQGPAIKITVPCSGYVTPAQLYSALLDFNQTLLTTFSKALQASGGDKLSRKAPLLLAAVASHQRQLLANNPSNLPRMAMPVSILEQVLAVTPVRPEHEEQLRDHDATRKRVECGGEQRSPTYLSELTATLDVHY